MKRLISPKFLALILLIVWTIGCSLAPTFTPKPTATLSTVPNLVLPNNPTISSPTANPNVSPDSNGVLSGTDVQTIEFIGKKFELKFKSSDQPVQTYEYYLSNESPSDWFELTEIQYYPVHPTANQPADFAKRTAEAFIQQYPTMKYSLLTNGNTDEAILDFFYPTSTREGYLEFDAFKFFKDPNSSQIIGFHYAKNIEDINSSRSYDNVLGDIKTTRKETESAMAKFNLVSK
jgi:hypothetical protein